MKYLVKILLALAITNLNAQNVAHFCIGSVHNFGVSENAGSIYDWKLNDLSIAEITSGNGTNLINIQFNNTGQVKLFVEETDVNGCRGNDSILIEYIIFLNLLFIQLIPKYVKEIVFCYN